MVPHALDTYSDCKKVGIAQNLNGLLPVGNVWIGRHRGFILWSWAVHFPSFSPKFLKPFSVNSLLLPQAVTQATYLNCVSVRRAGGGTESPIQGPASPKELNL